MSEACIGWPNEDGQRRGTTDVRIAKLTRESVRCIKGFAFESVIWATISLLAFSTCSLCGSHFAEQVCQREPSRVVDAHFHGTCLAQVNRQRVFRRCLRNMAGRLFRIADIASHD